jgi:hypothetical protein
MKRKPLNFSIFRYEPFKHGGSEAPGLRLSKREERFGIGGET